MINETTMYLHKSTWFLLINFQTTQTPANTRTDASGVKQERKLFMINSEDPKKFILKSSMKQSNETTVSELDPISFAGESESLTMEG